MTDEIWTTKEHQLIKYAQLSNLVNNHRPKPGRISRWNNAWQIFKYLSHNCKTFWLPLDLWRMTMRRTIMKKYSLPKVHHCLCISSEAVQSKPHDLLHLHLWEEIRYQAHNWWSWSPDVHCQNLRRGLRGDTHIQNWIECTARQGAPRWRSKVMGTHIRPTNGRLYDLNFINRIVIFRTGCLSVWLCRRRNTLLSGYYHLSATWE